MLLSTKNMRLLYNMLWKIGKNALKMLINKLKSFVILKFKVILKYEC